MKVWLIVGECGDHYCGCGLGHLAAVVTDENNIVGVAVQASLMKDSRGNLDFPHGVGIAEIDADKLIPHSGERVGEGMRHYGSQAWNHNLRRAVQVAREIQAG